METVYMKMKNKNVLLIYLFNVYAILMCTLHSGIYLRRNIPATDKKELRLTINKIL
jgi:hypothetical protein